MSPNPNTKTIDRGWRRIKREMVKATISSSVKIGVQSDAGKHKESDGKTDLVTVAAVNEFGAPKRGIPERSFIRSTADQQGETTLTMSAVLLDQIFHGTSTFEKSLGKLGQFMEDRIKETIKSRTNIRGKHSDQVTVVFHVFNMFISIFYFLVIGIKFQVFIPFNKSFFIFQTVK